MTAIPGLTTFRAATRLDIPALAALDTVALQEPQRRVYIEMWVDQGHCQIVESGGRIAGYGVLHRNFFSRPFIEMVMISVPFRQHGVGMLLLKHLVDCANAPKVFTSTNESNRPMRNLLHRAAFIESGRIDNLDENDPELIFVHFRPKQDK